MFLLVEYLLTIVCIVYVYLQVFIYKIYLILGSIADAAMVLDPLMLKEKRLEQNTYG